MKDFTQTGGTYTTFFDTPFIMLMIAPVMIALCVVILYRFRKKLKYKNETQKIGFYGDFYQYSITVILVGIAMIVASITVTIYIFATHDTYQDYKGRFEIVKSEADIVKNDSADSENKIVLKDKHGNKQEIEVNNGSGSFQKGEYADVTVQTVEGTGTPTLAKPINSGDIKVKTIEQADK